MRGRTWPPGRPALPWAQARFHLEVRARTHRSGEGAGKARNEWPAPGFDPGSWSDWFGNRVIFEGLYWGCPEPLTVLQEPTGLAVASVLWGLGREGRRRTSFPGTEKALLWGGTRRWEKWKIQDEPGRLRGWRGTGLPPGVWRARSVGFVRGRVAIGGPQSQEERMGGASWALNVCTTQGTRARTRHGQRVYLRKLKM